MRRLASSRDLPSQHLQQESIMAKSALKPSTARSCSGSVPVQVWESNPLGMVRQELPDGPEYEAHMQHIGFP